MSRELDAEVAEIRLTSPMKIDSDCEFIGCNFELEGLAEELAKVEPEIPLVYCDCENGENK